MRKVNMELIMDLPIEERVNELSEILKEEIAEVQADWRVVKEMPYQVEELWEEAANVSTEALSLIEELSNEYETVPYFIEDFVRECPSAVKYLKNPPVGVQLSILINKPDELKNISNPAQLITDVIEYGLDAGLVSNVIYYVEAEGCSLAEASSFIAEDWNLSAEEVSKLMECVKRHYVSLCTEPVKKLLDNGASVETVRAVLMKKHIPELPIEVIDSCIEDYKSKQK